MPISRAASGSCAVARIALPYLVLPTNQSSAISSGIVTPKAKTSERTTSTSRNVNSVFCEPIRSGAASGVGRQSRPTFWRMKLMPIAVISGASFGALRSGL